MLSEADIIKNLKTEFPQYIGDDAAVIDTHNNQAYVITKDLLVEDIHFRTQYFSPDDLAHKALHVNLSDVAAMGATPKFILCGIGIPAKYADYAATFLAGLAISCKNANVILIGGDTTASPDKIFISITAIGIANTKHIKYRHTAKINDIICIAGDLGHAHLGLTACEKSLVNCIEYKNAFLRPIAKINAGIWLGAQPAITSMMDISDGLFIDLKRLCEASNTSANIELHNLTYSQSFLEACENISLAPLETMLTGGEDYGLLFTVESTSYVPIARDFLAAFGYSIKKIGVISRGSGVHFTQHNKIKEFALKPFTHFGEQS